MHEDLAIFVEADWCLADPVGNFLNKGRQTLRIRLSLKAIGFQQIFKVHSDGARPGFSDVKTTAEFVI